MRVLGIDPAWTSRNPSGIALIEKDSENHWRCIRLAPSFQLFLDDDVQETNMFCGKISGSEFDLGPILEKVGEVDCIVVDMPLSNKPFSGRRTADNCVAQNYGAYLCATHTPTEEVINMGQRILAQAKKIGYCFNKTIIETYPHPAILALLPELKVRLQYKVGRRFSYWPDATPAERKSNLVKNMKTLRDTLDFHISLPSDFNFDTNNSFVSLKSFEDTLDALVCAWVGTVFLENENRCIPYGDADSTIWIPY